MYTLESINKIGPEVHFIKYIFSAWLYIALRGVKIYYVGDCSGQILILNLGR